MTHEDRLQSNEEVVRGLIGRQIVYPEVSVKQSLREAEKEGIDGVQIARAVHNERLNGKPDRRAPFGK